MEHQGLGEKLLLMNSMRVSDAQPLWLNRPLRGFEALLDYLKTEGKFKPNDPDVKDLMDLELEYFGLVKFDKGEA